MNKRFLIVLFLAAVVLRLAFVFFYPHRDMSNDSYEYHSIAVNLISGHGYAIQPDVPTARRSPGYPLFLSVMYLLFGATPVPVEIAQAMIGSLMCLLAFLLAKELFDERTAMISALAVGLHPVLVSYTGVLLTETLFSFFLLLTALLFVRALRSESVRLYFLAGISLGMTILTRPDMIVMPVLAGAVLFATSRNVLRSAARFAVFLAGIGLLFAPWTAYTYSRFHILLPGQSGGLGPLVRASAEYAQRGASEYDTEAWKGVNSYYDQLGVYANPEKVEKRLLSEGLSMIASHPANFAGLVARRLPKFWFTSHSAMFGIIRTNGEYLQEKKYAVIGAKTLLLFLQLLILALAAAGLVTRVNRSGGMLFLAALLLFPSLYVMLDGPSRHHVPFMPYLLIFASGFVSVVIGKFRAGETSAP